MFPALLPMHFVLHCSFSFFLQDKKDSIIGEKITKKCLLTLILSLNSVRCVGTTLIELSRHAASQMAALLFACSFAHLCLSDTCVANRLQNYWSGCKVSQLVILYLDMLSCFTERKIIL